MKHIVLSVLGFLFASNAFADTNALTCWTANGNRVLSVDRQDAASENQRSVYQAAVIRDGQKTSEPSEIHKLIYSLESKGPLAVVYINEEVVLIIPIDQARNQDPKFHPQGSLEITGEPGQYNVMCAKGPAY